MAADAGGQHQANRGTLVDFLATAGDGRRRDKSNKETRLVIATAPTRSPELSPTPIGDVVLAAQVTLAREARVEGIGFVSGSDSRLTFLPAEAGQGIRFVRTDLAGHPSIPAHLDHVVHCDRRTTLGRDGARVEMTEHVLAALAGLGIDNCTIRIDSGETPAMDGSSRAFTRALLGAGIVRQTQSRRPIVIDAPIRVDDGASSIEIEPNDGDGLTIEYDLEYSNPGIGRQVYQATVTPTSFVRDIAAARTFVLAEEVAALRSAGIGLRQTAKDLLVFAADGSVIENQLRFSEECARHKVLDVIGDLALVGRPIVGRVLARRCGHRHNVALARKIIEAHGAGSATAAAGEAA